MIADLIGAFDGIIKPATIWDPSEVFNMWVGDFFNPQTGGVLGYAQFPEQSGIAGLPPGGTGNGALTDGVVMSTATFQFPADNDGSFSANVGDFSMVTTHEIGHWIGLRHTSGDTTCAGDDFVADTPLQNGNLGCALTDSCTGDDFRDMVENYMDGTADPECANIYTFGQLERVEAVFANSPRRGSLLTSSVADFPDRRPYVFFEVEDRTRNEIEAEGCQPFAVWCKGLILNFLLDKQ